MSFGIRWRDQLPPIVADEFDNLISDIEAHFAEAHDTTGALLDSAVGADGSDGPLGPPGRPGDEGPRGYPGQPGDRGLQGIEGFAGRPGRHGEDGRDGIPGAGLADEISSFTPTDASGAALAFASAVGTYRKSGWLVTFTLTVEYPVTADASAAIIGGLPYTVGAATWALAVGLSPTAAQANALTATTTVPITWLGAAITNVALSGATVRISGSYRI